MCLACLDPIVDLLKQINPFKKKTSPQQTKDDDFDRDNIELPYMVEEKRSVMTSDPGVSDHTHDADDHIATNTVIAMKKVSSLALV